MLDTKNKINKDVFIQVYKPVLDIQSIKIFQELYPKIKDTFPKSKLYQLEQLQIDDNYLIYQNYVLESNWKEAPYEDFFRDFKYSFCKINGSIFKLHIEDSFLKTKSKICFKFILNCKN